MWNLKFRSWKTIRLYLPRHSEVKPVAFNPLGGAANLDHVINEVPGRHALNKKSRANQDLEILVGHVRNSFSDEIFVELL